MAVQRDKVIASAEKLVARGKIEPAIKEYERLLDDNPNDVNTLNRIGDLWVRINRSDEAVKVFARIADHYAKDGFFLKAIAIFKKINKLDPSKLDVYAKLADLYARQGLAMEAKSQYQVLADYYQKHSDPGNALLIYQKISELDPNSINVHVKLADLYSQNNEPANALKEYDRVGKMLLKRGMLDEAVQVFRKALKTDPRNLGMVDSLVTALLDSKDFKNARQLVDSALEANAGDARLLSMRGKIQLAAGDTAGARETLERALAANPRDASVRETLADLYLKQNQPDRSLEMLAPLADEALSRGERASAIDIVNRTLRLVPDHLPSLDRMVGLYTRLNEETNILSAMNSLAEAHIGKMQFKEAATVLERLVEREPQNAQHRTKLQFVRSQAGGAATPPTRATPPMEVEEPPPSFDFSDEPGGQISVADELGTLDIEFDEPEPRPTNAPIGEPEAPAVHLIPAVDQVAADLAVNENLDFITEHLTEAEVFAKYGLAEKAVEHLRTVLDRAPGNLTAHERLYRVLLEDGDVEGARTAAIAYLAILEKSGNSTAIDVVKSEFTSRGQTLPSAPAAVSEISTQAEIVPSSPTPVALPPDDAPQDFSIGSLDDDDDEISFDLGSDDAEIEFEIPEPEEAAEFSFASEESTDSPVPVSAEAPSFLTATPEEPAAIEFELPEPETGAVPEDEISFLPAEPAVSQFDELDVDLTEPSEEEEEPSLEFEFETPALDEEPPADTAEPFFDIPSESPAPIIEAPAQEAIAEIDLYLNQELFEEARRRLSLLLESFPDHPELLKRQQRVEAATVAVAPPPALSRDEIESELLSAIPDDDEDIMEPSFSAVPPASAFAHEENLFVEEDNFFDLAAELESELAEDDEPISLSEEEQSLEEIFREFKKGVEQQLDSEDYDTHYNLGIAYKEMGLIDEAIGEFQLASKDPRRAVECASMLGLCFLEKGMPQLAIKWYRKGLEMPEISEEEHVGLLYDLGAAYQEVGDTENAQKSFMEIYGMNSNYRDIVSRIKQVDDARK
jgi:pilus assembly protein FimV